MSANHGYVTSRAGLLWERRTTQRETSMHRNEHPSEIRRPTSRPRTRRLSDVVAPAAMGSWVILAGMPVVVVIVALT